jgi:hypothetical protein
MTLRGGCTAPAAILVGLGWASDARAIETPHEADAAKPCRPTVSCTAELAAPGTHETEIGAQYARLGGDGKSWNYPFLVKQTFTKLLQLQVGSNGYTVQRADATSPASRKVDNLVFGPKLHALDQGGVAPAVAFTTQLSVPAFADGNIAVLLVAHASKDVGPVHGDLNVGGYLYSQDTQPYGAFALSATPYAPIGVAVEAYAFADAHAYASRDGGVRGVVALTPEPWLVFDMGGDVGWFPSLRAATLFLGMTVIPVVFWRAE